MQRLILVLLISLVLVACDDDEATERLVQVAVQSTQIAAQGTEIAAAQATAQGATAVVAQPTATATAVPSSPTPLPSSPTRTVWPRRPSSSDVANMLLSAGEMERLGPTFRNISSEIKESERPFGDDTYGPNWQTVIFFPDPGPGFGFGFGEIAVRQSIDAAHSLARRLETNEQAYRNLGLTVIDIVSPARTRSVAMQIEWGDDSDHPDAANQFYDLLAFRPYLSLPRGSTGFVVNVSIIFNQFNPAHGLFELGGRILDTVYGRLDSSL